MIQKLKYKISKKLKYYEQKIAKNFNSLATNLSVLQNYFDSSTKLFSNLLSIAKFLDFSKIILSV